MENLYIPINSETILPDTVKSFDIFFQTEDKMVLYCSGGEEAKDEVLEKFKKNESQKLYIRKKDKTYYTLYVEEVLGGILNDPEIGTAKKANTAYNSVMNLAESLFQSPKAEIIQRYKNAIFDVLEFILNDNDALQNLINLTTYDFTTYNHSINVGIFSIGLTNQILEEGSDDDFEEIAAGFFLHDIGKTAIPIDILNKKGPLTNADWKMIKKHPEEGVKILDKFDALTEEAKIIVSQHHERHNGGGYPKGLKGDDIHVYSKICSIADSFDGLTSYRPYRKEHSTFDALKIMKNEMFKDFDPEYFSKFINLLSK